MKSFLVIGLGLSLFSVHANSQELQTGHAVSEIQTVSNSVGSNESPSKLPVELSDQRVFDVTKPESVLQAELHQFSVSPVVNQQLPADATVVVDQGHNLVSIMFKQATGCATSKLCAGPAFLAKIVRAKIVKIEPTRCGSRNIVATADLIDQEAVHHVITIRDNSLNSCRELILQPKTAVKVETLDSSGDVRDLKTFVGQELR